MSTLFTNSLYDGKIVDNNRSECDYWQQMLKLALNQKAQAGNMETLCRKRLAEIEAQTVERERSILVDSQVEYQA